MAAKPMKLDSDDGQPISVKKVDAAAAAEPTEPRDEVPSRQGDQIRPYCRKHHVLMRSNGTSAGVTHYACPVPDCKETAKKAQPRSMIPREPQECPKCRQRNAEREVPQVDTVYCQVDFGRSTSGNLMLVCPRPECNFHVLVPRPDVVVRSIRMRASEESLTG